MCQDPRHPFLWIQVLNKIRKISYFSRKLLRWYPPFPSDTTLSLPRQNFEKSAQGPAKITELWIQDSNGSLSILVGCKSLHQRKIFHKTLYHGQSGAILIRAITHYVLPESKFKDKTSQGMEHVWSPERIARSYLRKGLTPCRRKISMPCLNLARAEWWIPQHRFFENNLRFVKRSAMKLWFH